MKLNTTGKQMETRFPVLNPNEVKEYNDSDHIEGSVCIHPIPFTLLIKASLILLIV